MAEVTVYVDPDASGLADGSSWVNAYNSLNAAEAANFLNFEIFLDVFFDDFFF